MQSQLDAFQSDTRPWVVVAQAKLEKPLAIGEKPRVQFSFINSGRSPALNVDAVATVIALQSITEKELNAGSHGEIQSKMTLGPNGTGVSTCEANFVIPDSTAIEDVRNGSVTIYAKGEIEYWDTSQPARGHHTKFCWWINGADLDTLNLHACAIGNTAD